MLQSVGSQRVRHDYDIYTVKAMVFPLVIYGCQSWTIKKAERRRIDAFELWCSLDSKEIQPVHSKGDQS